MQAIQLRLWGNCKRQLKSLEPGGTDVYYEMNPLHMTGKLYPQTLNNVILPAPLKKHCNDRIIYHVNVYKDHGLF